MKSKLLVVEDHADTALVMAMHLRKAGHLVTVAGSCKEALEAAAADVPEVVLCDIGLPDGDGCDLLRELKQKYKVAGIAVSGHGMPEDQQRYRDAGFSEFVFKPCKIDQLQEAIVRSRLFVARGPSTAV